MVNTPYIDRYNSSLAAKLLKIQISVEELVPRKENTPQDVLERNYQVPQFSHLNVVDPFLSRMERPNFLYVVHLSISYIIHVYISLSLWTSPNWGETSL
jgi:hypothetical protein